MKPSREKVPVQTVEIVCIVEDPMKPTYRIAGVAQKAGDHARLPLGDANDLERRGKARIVEGTEKRELL